MLSDESPSPPGSDMNVHVALVTCDPQAWTLCGLLPLYSCSTPLRVLHAQLVHVPAGLNGRSSGRHSGYAHLAATVRRALQPAGNSCNEATQSCPTKHRCLTALSSRTLGLSLRRPTAAAARRPTRMGGRPRPSERAALQRPPGIDPRGIIPQRRHGDVTANPRVCARGPCGAGWQDCVAGASRAVV